MTQTERRDVQARVARRTRERAARKEWREQDFPEAVRSWGCRCAFCGSKTRDLTPSRYHLAPLPACPKCQDARTQLTVPRATLERIVRYVENAHPGCPLPRAYQS